MTTTSSVTRSHTASATRSQTTLLPPKDGFTYRVLAYERVSKDEEMTGSHTFETQGTRIRERIERLYGTGNYVLEVLRDDGISGGYGPTATGMEKRVRKTLKTLQEKLHTRSYDLFIVYHTDRFARNPRWFFQLLEDDILPNAQFLSVCEELDFTTPQGRAMAGMVAVFNGMTRDRIIERNRDAAATRVEQGYFQGMVPYGWQWEPLADVAPHGRRRIVPIAEQGQWIVQMKDWYLAGWGLAKIVAELNRRGVAPPAATKPNSVRRHEGKVLSGKWSYSMVWKTLANVLHVGLVPSRTRGNLPGEHAPQRYFDPEVREAILQARDGRKKFAPTNTGSQKEVLLLNGLPTCARCGERLHPTRDNKGVLFAYRCLGVRSTGQQACEGSSIRIADLDALVLEQLTRVAQDPNLQALLQAEARQAHQAQDTALCAEGVQWRERMQDLQTQHRRLVNALGRGVLDEEEFTAQNRVLKAELTDAQARSAQITQTLAQQQQREAEWERVQALLSNFAVIWKHLNLAEQREVMRLAVESLRLERVDEASGPSKSGSVMTQVQLKLVLLPARTVLLQRGRRPRQEKPTTGFAGLTPRHLAYLHWVHTGKNREEAAACMQITCSTIRVFEGQIRKRVHMQDMAEIARIAQGYIHAKGSTLPLAAGIGPQARQVSEPGGLHLSTKLLEVLPLLARGATTKEIAKMTGLPWSTVVGRKQLLLEATHSKTVYEAVQKAQQAGLV